MLRELAIRNFAIIDDLSMTFEAGLTVLTGETGAGKSILINAVNLIMGARASAEMVRTSEDAAELEAFFEVPAEGEIVSAAEKQGIDLSEGLLIRRVIGRDGRHKIYINGRLGTGRMLSELNTYLAGISGQHAYQNLLKQDEHLRLLDAFGGTEALCGEVSHHYHRLVPLIKRLEDLKHREADQAERLELLEYQVAEIRNSGVVPGEDETLESDIRRARHAEQLFETIQGCVEELYNQDGAVVERLGGIGKDLKALCEFDEGLGTMAQRIDSATLELEDLAQEITAYLQDITFDGHQLEEMERRMDVLQKLKRKYGGSLEAVMAYADEAQTELDQVTALPEKIRETEEALQTVERDLKAACQTLSEERREAAERLAAAVAGELKELGMDNTRFEVSFQPVPAGRGTPASLLVDDGAIEATGAERVEFLIAPNVGEALRPLARIASGGELSRIVLAMKSILATQGAVETLIFDEVDAGIGGRVAEMIGKKLKSLAAYHQVICITHLPQIASFASHHFRIDKEVVEGRTRTKVMPIAGEDRVAELARMLGGAKVTAKTLAYAREMVSAASSEREVAATKP